MKGNTTRNVKNKNTSAFEKLAPPGAAPRLLLFLYTHRARRFWNATDTRVHTIRYMLRNGRSRMIAVTRRQRVPPGDAKNALFSRRARIVAVGGPRRRRAPTPGPGGNSHGHCLVSRLFRGPSFSGRDVSREPSRPTARGEPAIVVKRPRDDDARNPS